MDTLRSTLVGAVSVTSLLVALFFLRFWYSTRDLFFLLFSIAFGIYGSSLFQVGELASTSPAMR